MKVLIACELSGTARNAFCNRGHDAYSCDLMPPDEPSPRHFQEDCRKVIEREGWDLIIAHPPCTHLAVSGARWFKDKQQEQADALEFVRLLLDAPIPRIALENPVSIISSRIRKPDQIIQPWQFGDKFQKTTCLWLNGLPKLQHTEIVERGEFYISPKTGKKLPSWYGDAVGSDGKKLAYGSEEMKKVRSKTFPGIATAMATQWIPCLSEPPVYQPDLFTPNQER